MARLQLHDCLDLACFAYALIFDFVVVVVRAVVEVLLLLVQHRRMNLMMMTNRPTIQLIHRQKLPARGRLVVPEVPYQKKTFEQVALACPFHRRQSQSHSALKAFWKDRPVEGPDPRLWRFLSFLEQIHRRSSGSLAPQSLVAFAAMSSGVAQCCWIKLAVECSSFPFGRALSQNRRTGCPRPYRSQSDVQGDGPETTPAIRLLHIPCSSMMSM